MIGRPPGDPRHHPNVLCVVAAGEGWIALRFAANGDLASYARKSGAMEAKSASTVMRGVVSGLAFLHKSGFIHRDMKLANVLVLSSVLCCCLLRCLCQLDSDLTPWLSDFGFACERVPAPPTKKLGTPPYMAPEIIAGTAYDETVDTYAVGVVRVSTFILAEHILQMLWELLAGQVPYQSIYLADGVTDTEAAERIYELVGKGERPEPVEAMWGEGIVSLVKKCWDQQPRNRPSLESVLRELTPP